MGKIKKFNEWLTAYGDEHQVSWAGSLYAFQNPEVKPQQSTVDIDLKQSYPHRCLNCNIEYFFIEEDGEPTCPNCDSTEQESISLNIN